MSRRPRRNWPRWCRTRWRVSVELREAVILRDLQDLDYKEIAQVLGIPEGTVKSRISRGRAELARLLERNKREVM
jgi:RNA polymerase sigma-70 factor (ECF subfamily)